MFCCSCGTEVPENADVCPSCGCDPKSGGKFCHICGAAITDGAVWHCSWAFCRSCATAIRENSDTLSTKAEAATLADYVELKQDGRRGAPMGTLGLIGLCVLVFILELCRFGWDPSAADLLAKGPKTPHVHCEMKNAPVQKASGQESPNLALAENLLPAIAAHRQ